MANRRVDEVVFANLVGDVVGVEVLINAYFNNDAKSVIGALSSGISIKKVDEILDKSNYNLSRSFTGKSDLGEIQKQMVDLYMAPDNVMSFENHLVTNKELLEFGIEYNGLSELKENFTMAKDNMPSLQKTV